MFGDSLTAATDSEPRRERITRLVDECLVRLTEGQSVSEAALLEAHEDLMPELGEELRRLRLFAGACQQAALDGPEEDTKDGTPQVASQQSLSGDLLRIRCPHCHSSIDVHVDISLADVACTACGQRFNLVGDEAITPRDDANRQLHHFELLEQIGTGGFGTVWKARDKELDRLVAVKFPRRGQLTPDETQQFLREARAAAQLKHPNIVSVHEVGRDGERVYIVSDLVEGPSLAEWNSTQRMSVHEAAAFCRQVAEALSHAHAAGIVHRDLKPANILIDADGQPHLTDFGLASRRAQETTMTLDGQMLGTPAYMSPEQARGEAHSADQHSDIFSLGVILYELLTGELPFRGSVRMLLEQIIADDPTRLRSLNSLVPRDLETICLKCLEKDPDRRYASAKELTDDLTRFLRGEPIHARPVGRMERIWRWCGRYPAISTLAFALACTLLLGFLAVTWQRRDASRSRQTVQQARQRELSAAQKAEASAKELRLRDERLKTAVDLVERARKGASDKYWDDASLGYSQAIEIYPELDTAWEERGAMYLNLGLTELAAADIQSAFEIRRPSETIQWFRHAILRLYTGDTAGYKSVCDRMIPLYKTQYGLARILALSPASKCDPNLLVLLAHIVKDDRRDAEILHTLGMSYYRANRFDEAIAACRDAIENSSPASPAAINYPILAMAQFRLNRREDSQESIAKASAAYDAWLTEMVNHFEPFWQIHYGAQVKWPIDPLDWTEFRIHYREACTLIGLPVTDDPRLHILRARGYAGLRRTGESVAEYDIALKSMPHDERLRLESHRVRGMYCVHFNDFASAAVEYTKAAELSPDDYYIWRLVAIARLASGDVAGYRHACAELVSRFSNTSDPTIAGSVVDPCTTYPHALESLNSLVPLAELSLQIRGPILLARTYYRTGNYEKARLNFVEPFVSEAIDRYFLAMTHYRLGDINEAQRIFAEAEAWVKTADEIGKNGIPGPGVRNYWGAWTERPQALALQSEARALIFGEGQVPSAFKK